MSPGDGKVTPSINLFFEKRYYCPSTCCVSRFFTSDSQDIEEPDVGWSGLKLPITGLPHPQHVFLHTVALLL